MQAIKDAHSHPQTEETLDCLNGAEWFTSLDLKLGYWQVEMEEDSKALTAFTLGPLGFCECDAFQTNKCSCHFPTFNAKLLRQSTLTILYHIS